MLTQLPNNLSLFEGATLTDSAIHVVIDPTRQPYLADHRFGPKMLVPATMIMEYFAQGALSLGKYQSAGDLRVVAIEDLKIYRALAVSRGEALKASIRLEDWQRTDDGLDMRLAIVSPRVNANGRIIGERLNADCWVRLCDQPDIGVDVVPRDLKEDEPNATVYEFERASYYQHFFPSHGPLFQSLTGHFSVSCDNNTLIGTYDCLDKERYYLGSDATRFVLSPLGFDSTLQYAVFLSRVHYLYGRLPVGIKRAEFFHEHPREGICQVRIDLKSIDKEIMEANITIFSGAICVMKGTGFRFQRSFMTDQHSRETFDAILAANEGVVP